MGKHSAPSRGGSRLERLAANSLVVLLVTSIVAAVVFLGITAIASAKNNEIPPPTVTAATFPQADIAPVPAVGDAPPDEGALRTCPATGCSAADCHAETGAPPPHR